jgi:hypothetical protein
MRARPRHLRFAPPPAWGTKATLDMQSILFGRTLKGIIEGDSVPSVFIPRLIALHRQGKFPLEQIVTRDAFEDINKAVRETESGLTVKAILRMRHARIQFMGVCNCQKCIDSSITTTHPSLTERKVVFG